VAVEFRRDRQDAFDDSGDEVFAGVLILVAGEEHPDAGENEEGAEEEDHPVHRDQPRGQADHDPSHEDCPEDSPEQDAVLI
jgi:hypothetical protein